MSALDEELLIDADDDAGPEAGDQPYTDLGNARRLVAAHGTDLHHSPQMGSWLAWDGHRFAEDLTGEVHRRAKAVVDAMFTQLSIVPPQKRKALFGHWNRSQSAGRLEAMVRLAATEPAVPVLASQLDADPWALNTLSGLVDLRTGDIHGHDRRSLVTKLAPIVVDPAADCPTWRWFVDWAMCGDTDLVDYLQRSVGYTLTGHVTEQVMQINWGGGANGKSTFMRVFAAMLGDYSASVDPDLLMASKHEQHPTGLTQLLGRRLAVAQETQQGRKIDETTVKQLTGGDRITARRMRQDFFEFDPSAKLWMSTNHRPAVRGTDHAIWRRMRLIPWNAQIGDADRDEHLVDRLLAELPGIFNWAMEGCRRWQEIGLDAPASIVNATVDYRAEEDHVGRFLDDCCLVGDGWKITAKSLREAYEAWCKENGEHAWSAKALGPQLADRGCERFQDGRDKAWTWRGLSLASSPQAADRRLDNDPEIF